MGGKQDSANVSATDKHRVDFELKFHEVVKSPYFIDKTLFLKYIFNKKDQVCALLAPPGFGKSVNLSMVQEFFEARVDEEGNIIPQEQSLYYSTFKKLKIWGADKGGFFKDHNANYPVLCLDLRHFSADGDFKKHIASMMASLYLKYEFLSKSNKLTSSERDLFEATKQRLMKGENFLNNNEGRFLLQVLFKHYGKKVFILIDQFDSPVVSALQNHEFGVTELEALNFLSKYLGIMCKGPPEVFTVVFSGVTIIGAININTIIYISAFDNEAVAQFYGFTKDEVKKIAENVQKINLIKSITDYFDGYRVPNTKMSVYNMQCVIRSFEKGVVQPYSNAEATLSSFKHLFRYNLLGPKIEKTLLDIPKEIPAPKIIIDELVNFQQMLSNQLTRIDISAEMLFFQYLLDQGFYTKVEEDNFQGAAIIIPNEEIRQAFRKTLYTDGFIKDKFQTDEPAIKNYLETVKNLDESHPSLSRWKKAVLRLFHNRIPEDEREMSAALFTLPWIAFPGSFDLIRTEKYKKEEATVNDSNGDYLDVLVNTKSGTAVIIESKFDDASDGLRKIIKGQYFSLDKFETVDNWILIGLAWTKEKLDLRVAFSKKGQVGEQFSVE